MFQRLDELLDRCRGHLERTNAFNTEVEYIFVQYLLVRICAEYEMVVLNLMEQRARRSGDLRIVSLMMRAVDVTVRRLRVGDIKGLLKHLGVDLKDKFDAAVPENSKPCTDFNSIVDNRNAVAHGEGVQVTLSDLLAFYSGSQPVLQAFADILNES